MKSFLTIFNEPRGTENKIMPQQVSTSSSMLTKIAIRQNIEYNHVRDMFFCYCNLSRIIAGKT